MVPIFIEYNVGHIAQIEHSEQWLVQMNRLKVPHTLLTHTSHPGQVVVNQGKWACSKILSMF